MVTAIVLLTVQRDKINSTAEQIADMEGISEVYSVGGRFDMVAIVRTNTNEKLAELVTNQLLKIDAIKTSETLIAFKAFSRHDLERMFSIGFEE